MRKQTLLIADRDGDFRSELQHLIRQQGFPAVFWECCNGPEAIKYINALQPDMVLLNVDLPGKNGFEVLDTAIHAPAVILFSDSPTYAAQAFDYHAVDYLLKPLTAARVNCALRRFEQLKLASPEIPSSNPQKLNYPSRILVEKRNRLTSIPVDKITHLKADKDYTWIHTLNGESYLSTHGIGQLERKLNPQIFIRIHRSYIVNIEFIQELYRDISKLFISLPNNVEINVGRNYMPAIKELMF